MFFLASPRADRTELAAAFAANYISEVGKLYLFTANFNLGIKF